MPAPAVQAAPAAQANTDFDADAATRRLDFLAKVSHEVRTPLNSIIGFTELMLQERFGPIGNARYKGYAEDIHQSGLYALSLLNDLLDISKIEAGKFELDFTAVDVAEVVESCVASLQPLAKQARIVLRTSLADDLPVVVADPRRLKQILLNLLTNAIKFTKEGGQVIVSGTMVNGELRLRVRDSGVGMTQERDRLRHAALPSARYGATPAIWNGARAAPHQGAGGCKPRAARAFKRARRGHVGRRDLSRRAAVQILNRPLQVARLSPRNHSRNCEALSEVRFRTVKSDYTTCLHDSNTIFLEPF